MTIRQYITSKFQSFGINLSEADLFDIYLSVDFDEDMTKENRNLVYKIIAKDIIPHLLNRPKSISENGFSVSYDTDDLLRYHAWLCKEVGIEDTLNKVSKISDASDLW